MAITERQLVGAWTLLSWQINYAGTRPTTYPFGEDAHGLITYSESGWMSATMSMLERSQFSSGSARKSSIESKASAVDEYLSYGGRWTIEGTNVIHDVLFSVNPVLIGTRQVRNASLDSDQLELSAQEGEPGEESSRVHRLIWRHT